MTPSLPISYPILCEQLKYTGNIGECAEPLNSTYYMHCTASCSLASLAETSGLRVGIKTHRPRALQVAMQRLRQARSSFQYKALCAPCG